MTFCARHQALTSSIMLHDVLWSAQVNGIAEANFLASPSLESLTLDCLEVHQSAPPSGCPRMYHLSIYCKNIHDSFFTGLPVLSSLNIGARCRVSALSAAAMHVGKVLRQLWLSLWTPYTGQGWEPCSA